MNTDVGDLISKIKIKNPMNIGAFVALVVAIALVALVGSSLFRTLAERRRVQQSYDATILAVTKLREAQKQMPVTVAGQVAEAKELLKDLLSVFPTSQQVTQELAQYYQLATDYNTQLIRMDSALPAPEEGAEAIYRKEIFFLEARGNAHDLLRFLRRLAGGPFETFFLDNVSVRSENPPVAEADLTVYYSDLGGAAGPTLMLTPSP